VLGARLEIALGDGRVLRGADLAGVILHLRDGDGAALEIRIDGVSSPPAAPFADMELYALSRRDSQGGWSPLCKPGADGRALAVALSGAAVPDDDSVAAGDRFSFACTAGARGKCVMLGYRPWAAAADGRSLQPHFAACVRMMRADYCGDGKSHTQPGLRVDMWDDAGVQAAQTSLPFEAAWSPDGAICLFRPRAPAVSSFEDIIAACPRLADHASDCESWSRDSGSGAILWNRSVSAE
jgi:hypothetical protein